jgi:putative DNA primase/helicase
MSVMDYAKEYLSAGISVLPIRTDGTKGPAIGAWKQLQSRLATDLEVLDWFSGEVGIGVITGAVSGNLEVIDFDMNQLLWPVLTLLPDSLRNRLSVYETPGGWHVAYRCEEICGNTKIAMWEPMKSVSRVGFGPSDCGKGVRIETRGEGGYIVAEGSPVDTHNSGLPYCHYMGPRLENVETITKEERKLLWLTCNEFDLSEQRKHQTEQVAKRVESKPNFVDYEKPWDWFDRAATWDGILLPLGWSKCGNDAYTRPGKKHGVSASTGKHNGVELLKIWSSSVAGSDHRALGKFNALVEMKFSGNRSEAVKYVAELMRGYL